MASPFARAVAAAAVTHDRIHGDPFTFAPMKYPTDRNAPLIPDTDRSVVFNVICPYGEPASRAASGPVGFTQVGTTTERAGQSTSRPYLSLDLSRLPWRPRIGDQVIQEGTGRRFRIHEVLPSTPGFVRLTLNGI